MLLNLRSYFSLRFGTLSLQDLISGMLAGGYDTAVLTDINNSSGSLDFVKMGRAAGLNLLAGMEFRNGDQLCYVAIAKNERGFQEINAYRTKLNMENRSTPERAPDFEQVFVIYPFRRINAFSLRDFEYIGIRPSERTRAQLLERKLLDRCVILAPVSFRKADYTLHRQLRAIDNNLLISQLEREQLAAEDEVFVPKAKLIGLFSELPQVLANTSRILAQCSFGFDFTSVKNKATFTGNRYNDKQLLHTYCMDGFARRYGRNDHIAGERIQRELEIIENLRFSSYFLITDDICRYARGRNFHYVGRGSGANSAVAYCLGITDVDPIALNLPFERFLNPKRKSPPDFDVDFAWNERDAMHAYIFDRYQTGHTALMGAMSTFRSRSILSELGKVYGLPKAEIDRLVHEPEHMLNKNEVTNTILSVYNRMADFPNQRTIHASGVLISEEPLTCYSAMDNPPKGLPTMQFDMYVAEDIGFEKFDILSQRGIGHIKDCRTLVRENLGVVIDTDNPKRFFQDVNIAAQLKSANTIGCFYIESPAMRQLLTKLRCDDYLTLVAASSIIRPGVASSGMMGEYIRRHHDPATAVYPHPVFKEQLEETYGVMVYQEDVMKIANAYGGLDMADADVLRRMMSGKYRSKDHLIEI
ncbi:PHP domain-containing protein [Sphingobacterium sp. HMA12]|uniref:PHP domain-containing protein n=1 Tax=Sphingobacterium sp. HMA12 TaxID=2050894 RepID=UPI001F161F9C|nr:PHP domain-containing protein [Sphingobacterium sp. HMA12]